MVGWLFADVLELLERDITLRSEIFMVVICFTLMRP